MNQILDVSLKDGIVFRPDPVDRKTIEILSEEFFWKNGDSRARVLLYSLNIPGYYSLAIRTLSLSALSVAGLEERFDIRFSESTVESDLEAIAASILEMKLSLLALSVNIWNRDAIFHLIEILKKSELSPVILAGGQEVTGSSMDYMNQLPGLDYLIDGEGEIPLAEFLREFDPETGGLNQPESVSGLSYRSSPGSAKILKTGPARVIEDLDQVPSMHLCGVTPSDAGRSILGGVLEGARSCSMRCSFCFEGEKRSPVRFGTPERLGKEAFYLLKQGFTKFHFLDPIFCSHKKDRLNAYRELFYSMHQENPDVIIIIEGYADLIDEDVAGSLAPFVRVDIGLQTIHTPVNRAIHRRFVEKKWRAGIEHLRKNGISFNIYLIAGLPEETLTTFLSGIPYIMKESPTQIFLNDLCILNGTELRRRSEEYGYIFEKSPPYRALSSRWMSHPAMKFARIVSLLMEQKYNHSTITFKQEFKLALGGYPKNDPWLVLDLARPGDKEKEIVRDFIQKSKDSLTSASVIVWCGENMDEDELIRIASRLIFSGVCRLGLQAPLAFMQRMGKPGTFIVAGYFSFKVVVRSSDYESKGFGLLKELLSGWNVPHNSRQTRVRPGIATEFQDPVDWKILERDAAFLLEMKGTSIDLINPVIETNEFESFAELFVRAVTGEVWIKLPVFVLRPVLEWMKQKSILHSGDDIDSILKDLTLLDLVFSHQEMQSI